MKYLIFGLLMTLTTTHGMEIEESFLDVLRSSKDLMVWTVEGQRNAYAFMMNKKCYHVQKDENGFSGLFSEGALKAEEAQAAWTCCHDRMQEIKEIRQKKRKVEEQEKLDTVKRQHTSLIKDVENTCVSSVHNGIPSFNFETQLNGRKTSVKLVKLRKDMSSKRTANNNSELVLPLSQQQLDVLYNFCSQVTEEKVVNALGNMSLIRKSENDKK